MSLKELNKILDKTQAKLETTMKRTLPVALGALAQNHFRDNFRRKGFVNNGITPWKPTKRQSRGGSGSRYGPLLSRERNLFKSITYTPRDYAVRVYTPLVYASVHNEGGLISSPITAKMRRFFWAKYYEASKGKKEPLSADAKKWRALALTKKHTLVIYIPKRQFMGPSKELETAITKTINERVTKALSDIY